MPDLIKPDMKSLLWLGIGFLVLPKLLKRV